MILSRYLRISVVGLVTGVISSVAVPRAAQADECVGYYRGLRSLMRQANVAMQGRPHYERARTTWQAAPAACRDGRWYLMAAHILRWSSARPLVAGSVQLASARDALTAGLIRAPTDPELLAFVAFVSALRPKASPPLPTNACAAVRQARTDLRHYICGHAARRTGDWKTAARCFAAIKRRSSFFDLSLRRAEALRQTGARRRARREAARARKLTPIRARAAGVTLQELQLIRAAAKRLAR